MISSYYDFVKMGIYLILKIKKLIVKIKTLQNYYVFHLKIHKANIQSKQKAFQPKFLS